MEEKEEGGAGTTSRQRQVQVQLAGPGRQQVFGGEEPFTAAVQVLSSVAGLLLLFMITDVLHMLRCNGPPGTMLYSGSSLSSPPLHASKMDILVLL